MTKWLPILLLFFFACSETSQNKSSEDEHEAETTAQIDTISDIEIQSPNQSDTAAPEPIADMPESKVLTPKPSPINQPENRDIQVVKEEPVEVKPQESLLFYEEMKNMRSMNRPDRSGEGYSRRRDTSSSKFAYVSYPAVTHFDNFKDIRRLRPGNSSDDQGIVFLEVCLDSNGLILDDYTKKSTKSTTNSNYLYEISIKALEKFAFEATGPVKELNCGLVEFNYNIDTVERSANY